MEENSQLLGLLDYVDASRKRRLEMADFMLEHPEKVHELLSIGLSRQDSLGSRACWVLEFTCNKTPELIYPHLNEFISGLEGLTQESSIRPMAKICEVLMNRLDTDKELQEVLTGDLKEIMAEACFDWVIGPVNVAPKAYSMNTLFLLGKDIPWIHRELKLVLEKDYPSGSPAYQARARMVLEKIHRFGA